MAVERGIRLALRAEQTTRGTAAGAAIAMSQSEIRVDEATGLLERISLIDKTTGPYGYRGETERILRGRIDALRPEQTSDDDQPEGLTYRQEVAAGMTVSRENPWRHDGSRLRLTVDVQPYLGADGLHVIPPYQADQLRAIADGRPSWPNVEKAGGVQAGGVELDIDPLIDWLADAVAERLR